MYAAPENVTGVQNKQFNLLTDNEKYNSLCFTIPAFIILFPKCFITDDISFLGR